MWGSGALHSALVLYTQLSLGASHSVCGTLSIGASHSAVRSRRYIGWLMGVEEENNPCESPSGAKAWLESIVNPEPNLVTRGSLDLYHTHSMPN